MINDVLGICSFPRTNEMLMLVFRVTGAVFGFSVISLLLLFALVRNNAIKDEACPNTRDGYSLKGASN